MDMAYTPEQRDAIIMRVLSEVATGRSVADVMDAKDMPGAATFWVWHFRSPELQDNLARAREIGVEAHIDKMNAIADGRDIERDEEGMLKRPEDAYLMDTQRAKLRIETRLKMAQMMAPRKYGQKIDLTSGGKALAGPADADTASRAIAVLSKVERRVIDNQPDDRTLDLLS